MKKSCKGCLYCFKKRCNFYPPSSHKKNPKVSFTSVCSKWRTKVEPMTTADKVAFYFKEGLYPKEIAELLGVSVSCIGQHKKSLFEKGLLKKSDVKLARRVFNK